MSNLNIIIFIVEHADVHSLCFKSAVKYNTFAIHMNTPTYFCMV